MLESSLDKEIGKDQLHPKLLNVVSQDNLLDQTKLHHMGDMNVMRGELSNTATDHRETAIATSIPPSKIIETTG